MAHVMGSDVRRHASCYISAAVEQTIATGAGYTNALDDGSSPATTTAVLLQDFTHTSPGRLTYTGVHDMDFNVDAHVSLIPGSASGIVWTLAIYHYDASGASGAVVPDSLIERRTAATTVAAASVGTLINLSTNDYIELHMKHDDGGQNQDMTVSKMMFKITEV